MESNETYKMAKNVTNYLEKNFGNKIQDVSISDVVDDRNHRAFSIRFEAYNCFIVWFNYHKGRIGCSIQQGEKLIIDLETSQKWYEKADFDIFCKELQEQLELRIPDKFLEINGWK